MDKNYYNLFLDDDPKRIPHKLTWIELPPVEWVIVRNYKDFVDTILRDGVPERISFDHDLADQHYQEFHRANNSDKKFNYENVTEKTGYDCAKWLANHCVENNIKIPQYYVHTMNPMGAANIFSILESARKVMLELNECQSCHKNNGTKELHSCPYASDINNDDKEACNCCDECAHECLMDI